MGVSDVAIADASGVFMSGNFKTKIDFGGGPFSGPGGFSSTDYLVKLDAADPRGGASLVGELQFSL